MTESVKSVKSVKSALFWSYVALATLVGFVLCTEGAWVWAAANGTVIGINLVFWGATRHWPERIELWMCEREFVVLCREIDDTRDAVSLVSLVYALNPNSRELAEWRSWLYQCRDRRDRLIARIKALNLAIQGTQHD